MTQIPGHIYRPRIALVTALPKEMVAARALIDNAVEHVQTDPRGTRRYILGTMPSHNAGMHPIVLSMIGVGNTIAAAATTQLLQDFPSVETIVMLGIAGGIPHPANVQEHVRLGDIVVSNERGVVQYDFVKDEFQRLIPRHPPRPPSAQLLRAVRTLEAKALAGETPWDDYIRAGLDKLRWTRPPPESDILISDDDPSVTIPHPEDPTRLGTTSRVFVSAIASSNTLLKNSSRRNRLRDDFGAKAVEMEGAGTGDAAWMTHVGHLVVRGICDYCDLAKSDAWQPYAAIAAAAYVRALLAILEDGNSTSTSRRAPEVTIVSPNLINGPLRGFEGREDLSSSWLLGNTKALLRELVCEMHQHAQFAIPLLSWADSLSDKLHCGRLLKAELQAITVVHTCLQTSFSGRGGSPLKPPERFAMSLHERYPYEESLRTNWEARCALGNLLTSITSSTDVSSRRVVKWLMEESLAEPNWDLAQVLFDSLHHGGPLNAATRDYLFSVASAHPHRQARWNVAAALKSVEIERDLLRRLLRELLTDKDPWVRKTVLEEANKDVTMQWELAQPWARSFLQDTFEEFPRLIEHVLLTQQRDLPLSSLAAIAGSIQTSTSSQKLVPNEGTIGGAKAGLDVAMAVLREDIANVQKAKKNVRGRHGKVYAAAEYVAMYRMANTDPQRREQLYWTYLDSTHDALAWASARIVFSEVMRQCGEPFFANAIARLLEHRSEWIIRECVEGILRMGPGRAKYLALRQLEERQSSLRHIREVLPYLREAGFCQ